MTNQSSISNAPMILGIIGGVLGLPAAVCAGACASAIGSVSAAVDNKTAAQIEEAGKIGNVYLIIGIAAALIGLIASFLYKKKPMAWGIVMLVAAILECITLITFNILPLIVAILFLIAGAISISQNKKLRNA